MRPALSTRGRLRASCFILIRARGNTPSIRGYTGRGRGLPAGTHLNQVILLIEASPYSTYLIHDSRTSAASHSILTQRCIPLDHHTQSLPSIAALLSQALGLTTFADIVSKLDLHFISFLSNSDTAVTIFVPTNQVRFLLSSLVCVCCSVSG